MARHLNSSIRTASVFLMTLTALFTLHAGGPSGCGNSNPEPSSLNPNFPELSASPLLPVGDIDADNTAQVITIEAADEGHTGRIGTIVDQDPSHILCVIIDPTFGS
ncbi:MAG TPA: hypothetical protein VJQ25_07380, partial [Nitrospira sp.]|nr:hypothetical protein [Nitrospira sp.]